MSPTLGAVRFERESDAGSEFVSLADEAGTMVTLRFPQEQSCGSKRGAKGTPAGKGRARLAALLDNCRWSGQGCGSASDVIDAEIQVSSHEDRRRIACLEKSIRRHCAPGLAAIIVAEASNGSKI